MNAKIVTFSLFSLLFVAGYPVLMDLEIDVPVWFVIFLMVFAAIFALTSVILALADVFKACQDEALLKSRSKLKTEVENLEDQKRRLEADIERLIENKENCTAQQVKDLKNKVKKLEKKNAELLNKVDAKNK